MPKVYPSIALAGLALVAPAARAADASKIYAGKCQPCHGVGGKSPFPELSFLDDKWIHGSSQADVVKVIADGVPGKAMLPFKEQLSKAEIDALAKHVRSFSKKAKGAGK
jgi:mono/diheme cytochrome c family protein